MLSVMWTSNTAAEVLFLTAAIAAAIEIVIDLLSKPTANINFVALAVGLVALGLLAA